MKRYLAKEPMEYVVQQWTGENYADFKDLEGFHGGVREDGCLKFCGDGGSARIPVGQYCVFNIFHLHDSDEEHLGFVCFVDNLDAYDEIT